MTTKMPDLPEPFRIYQYRSAGQRIPEYAPLMNKPIVPVFTAEQMRDYAARHACAEISRLQAQVDALADALNDLSSEAAEGPNSCITRDSNGHAQWDASFSENIVRARAALAAVDR